MTVMPHARTSYRKRPARPGSTVRYTIVESYVGYVAIARTPNGLAALFIMGDAGALRQHMNERFPGSAEANRDAVTDRVLRAIENSSDDLDLALDPFGTEFQKSVWRALQEIPAGSTVSYSELAQRIGKPESVRAVAAACGANPIAIIVPCHRVVGKNGSLTGYAWGIERKKLLLEREKSARFLASPR